MANTLSREKDITYLSRQKIVEGITNIPQAVVEHYNINCPEEFINPLKERYQKIGYWLRYFVLHDLSVVSEIRGKRRTNPEIEKWFGIFNAYFDLIRNMQSAAMLYGRPEVREATLLLIECEKFENLMRQKGLLKIPKQSSPLHELITEATILLRLDLKTDNDYPFNKEFCYSFSCFFHDIKNHDRELWKQITFIVKQVPYSL